MKGIPILSFLLFCSVVSAKTYYVAPGNSSDSNAGTKDKPWATWSKAFSSVAAGDTVFFRGGVYMVPASNNGNGYSAGKDGTATNTICYFNYSGEVPILDFYNVTTSASASKYGLRINGNYSKFRGLTVRNLRQLTAGILPRGINVSCDHVVLENCKAYNIDGHAIETATADDVRFINCDVWNICDSKSGTSPGNDGNGFFDFNYSSASIANKVYFINCRAWNCGDQGFSSVSYGYTEFNGCWSFRNGLLQGEGWGFKLGWNDAPYNGEVKRKVINCIAAFNRRSGFDTNDGGKPAHVLQIYNNTAYHNGYLGGASAYGFSIRNTGGTDAQEQVRTFKNNLAYANEDGNMYQPSGALYTNQYNSWTSDIGVTVAPADFISVDSTGITRARQTEGLLPDLNFLKLAPGSDLIDAGTNVVLPYVGTAPDLGYLEYNSGIITQPTPVYVSSAIENTTPSRLEMTYSLSLANIVPAASAFAVTVNSIVRSVTAVTISSTKVLLTLSSPVVNGNSVTVAYTKPSSNPLQATSGGQAVSISPKSVTNRCIPPVNQPPLVSISSPNKNTSFISPAIITVDAVSSDPDGTVSKVEFFNGNLKLGEITTTPYSYTWKDVTGGTYSITAIATDNLNSKTSSSAVTVTVINSIPTENRQPRITKLLNLFPNPNNGRFSIEFLTPLLNNESTVTVFNVAGVTVYREILSKEEIIKQLDLSYLRSGIYILRITSAEIIISKKFIKE